MYALLLQSEHEHVLPQVAVHVEQSLEKYAHASSWQKAVSGPTELPATHALVDWHHPQLGTAVHGPHALYEEHVVGSPGAGHFSLRGVQKATGHAL